MNSKQLWNKRTSLVTAMDEAAVAENMDEAHRIEGEIRALDQFIAQVIDEEDAARAAQASKPVKAEPSTFAEKVLGVKDEFKGLHPGFKKSVSVKDAVSGLSTPQIYKRDLQGPVAPPTGFLDTILKGTTDGDEHFFKTPVLTNNAAGWTSGNKPESALAWSEGTALLETVAHWIPIKKQTANRYSQLESIVSTSLMLGLDLKCDKLALAGSNENGIIGITNTTGILVHTVVQGKNIRDTIETMARKVRVASGIAAGYVCMSPYAIECLNQTKDDNERYLFDREVAAGDKICGLTIVEDVNMTLANGKETALVYYAGGASWDIADPQEVTVGLVDKQFIQNEYTVLAELTATLRVDMPAAFCYCADLGIAAEDSGTESE